MGDENQDRLPGMPEPEVPDPAWKVVRRLESTKTVKDDAGRSLYQEKVVHTTTEESINAPCDTEAVERALRLMDDEVETFEQFQAQFGGACKSSFSAAEVKPRSKA